MNEYRIMSAHMMVHGDYSVDSDGLYDNEYFQAGMHDLVYRCNYDIENRAKMVDMIKFRTRPIVLAGTRCMFELNSDMSECMITFADDIVVHMPVNRIFINNQYYMAKDGKHSKNGLTITITSKIDTDDETGELEMLLVRDDSVPEGKFITDRYKHREVVRFGTLVSEYEAEEWWNEHYIRMPLDDGSHEHSAWCSDSDAGIVNLWISPGVYKYKYTTHSDVPCSDIWIFEYTGKRAPRERNDGS